MKGQILIFLLVLLILFSVACGQNYSGKEPPKAIKGVLDLREWDFEKDGIVKLDGEWEFYWDKLLTPEDFKKNDPILDGITWIPGSWKALNLNGEELPDEGYATYRLKILINKRAGLLSLRNEEIRTSYKIWVNEVITISEGHVKTSKNIIPKLTGNSHSALFESNSEVLQLILQVSNFVDLNGGIHKSLTLGTENQIKKVRDQNIALDMFLFGSLVIMALYHFGLFLLRKKNISFLLFGVFCLLIALYGLSFGEGILQSFNIINSLNIILRYNYLCGFLGAPIILAFVHSIFPKDTHRKALKIFLIVWAPLLLFLFFSPINLLVRALNIYAIMSLVTLIFVTYILFNALLQKQEGSLIFLFGFSVFFLTAISDLLSQNGFIETRELAPFGLFIFIFSQAYLLSKQFTNAFYMTENLSSSFARFVPMEILNFLKKESIIDVNLGDSTQKEMAVLFSDIRSFTTLSEKMSPSENFGFINSYLEGMGPIIRNNSGYIDKYIGDAIMALFPENSEDAVNTAIEMQLELNNFNKKRAIDHFEPIKVGVGLHTGNLILGTIGESERMDSTVISDAVNLASRLEGLTKIFLSYILASQDIIHSLNDSKFLYRKLNKVQVKGKTEPVTVYEILNAENDEILELKLKTKKQFEEGIELYQHGKFGESQAVFKEVYHMNNQDKVAHVFIEKCSHLLREGIPKNWNGVEVMNEK